MSAHFKDRRNPGPALHVRALKKLLVAKWLIDPAAPDALVATDTAKVGAHIGAKVVARTWIDSFFRERLLEDGSRFIRELGFGGHQGEDLIFVPHSQTVGWIDPHEQIRDHDAMSSTRMDSRAIDRGHY